MGIEELFSHPYKNVWVYVGSKIFIYKFNEKGQLVKEELVPSNYCEWKYHMEHLGFKID